MLVEIMKKYRDKSKYDLSCSESMVYAANEVYNLNLDENTFRALAPFSGGMWIEDVCGTLTGSLAVLGIIFTNNVAHESEHLKELTLEFIQNFESKLGSRNCAKLKGKYRTEEEGCNSVMYAAAEVLDIIVTRELKNN